MSRTTPVQLNRSITYPLLTLYGIGTILGAGIYVLVGKVALHSGLYTPFAFLLAAIIAGFSAYSYAALSSRYPKSAGEVNYIHAAFNQPKLSVLVGLLVVLTGVVSAATLANGFVGYMHIFIETPSFIIITVLTALITLVAIWGVKQAMAVAALITLIEVGGLVWIVVANHQVFTSLPQYLSNLSWVGADKNIWVGVLMGSFLAFYAFIGFEDMVNMSEETKKPQTTMPKAIITALIVTAIVYVVIALVAILSLPLSVLEQTEAPMADIMKLHSNNATFIISIIGLIAIINGALVQIIMGSRVLYGMSRGHLIPHWFGRVNSYSKTPILATLTIALITWVLAIAFPLEALAKSTSFVIIIVFLLVNIALIVILKKEQGQTPQGAMHISAWMPWAATILSVSFLFFMSVL